MQRIFVSFRKEDDRATREQLYARLSSDFCQEQVFKSGESIPPGTDYVRILWAQARACPVMLVLVGEGWLEAHEPDGSRSIDQHNDWVRLEIRTAFESGNRVIPVLLGDDVMLPAPAQLPPDIAALGTLQALRVAHSAVAAGLDQLVDALNATLPRLAQSGGPEAPAEPVAPGPHNEVRAHDVGVGMITGTAHGPVIGGDAQGPVIGGNARGPVVGGDFHQMNVKKGGVGAVAGLAAVLAALGRPFGKAADWAGDHRVIASISAAVVLAGAGTGIAVAINGGSSPSVHASTNGLAVIAATTPATDAATTASTPSASPTVSPALTSGASLSSVPTASTSGNAWADGTVLVVRELAQLASPGSDASNAYQLQTYSIATGQQLTGFSPDGLDQGTVCVDDLVRSAADADVLLAEKTDEVPAQGLTPASYSVDLMGIDATTGNKLWDATLPVVAGTSDQTDFCSRTDPPNFLSYTSDGKYALDTETGTTYLVNLATGAVTRESSATQALGRWLAVPSTAQVAGEGYPASVAIVDPTSGATVATVADNDTGLSGDAEGGDAGAPGVNGGEGTGTDIGGTVDLVFGTRVDKVYGETAEYALPSFSRIWVVPNGSLPDSDYVGLAYDPTVPGVAIGYNSPGGGNAIFGIDVKTGRTLWTVTAATDYCGVTNGHVYALANNQLVELDEATGKQISYDASTSFCPQILKGVIDKVASSADANSYTNDFVIG